MKQNTKRNGSIGIACALLVLCVAPTAYAAEKPERKVRIVVSASADLIEMRQKIHLLEEAVGLVRELRKAQGFNVPSAKAPKKITKPVRAKSPVTIIPSVRVRVENP